MLWQVTAREIEGHGNSKVQSKGSFAGELKVFFSEALFLLFMQKEIRIHLYFCFNFEVVFAKRKMCMYVYVHLYF